MRAGGEVFTRLCGACHPGGRAGLGPSLAGATARLSEQGIVSRVRSGGGMMPAFSAERITEQQLADLVAYLKTLDRGAVAASATPTPGASPTPTPSPGAAPTATPTAAGRPSPTPSPLATPQATVGRDAQAGGRVFASLCNACHPGGQKGLGPGLAGVTERMTDEVIASRVREGRGVMPAFSAERITEQQLADLLAYLATLK